APTAASRLTRLGAYLLLSALTLLMLYPVLWMVASSFKPEAVIFSDFSLWPAGASWRSYVEGWTALRVGFARFFLNSAIVAALAVIGNVVACSLAAFAFARLEFRLKRFWFAPMLGTLMLPYHVTLIPQYVLFLKL